MSGTGTTARRAVLAAGVLLAAAAIAGRSSYPALGRLTYRAGVLAERGLARLRSGSTEVDGCAMAYSIGGPTDAPAIVLLHGFSSDRDIWVRFARRLVGRYRVVIPDLLGHGDTGFVPGADYSAAAQAQRVAELLDALGIERAHLMGNSMGGFVAARFAYAYPERTLSLGLCDAAGVTAPTSSTLDAMLDVGRNPFLLDDIEDFDAFYPLTMARPPYLPRSVLQAHAQEYVRRRDELAAIFDSYSGRGMLDGRLSGITIPALVLWGAEDRLIDVSAAHVWADGLPNAELVVYDGVGHVPMMEIPERSAADYADFLDRLEA